MTVMAVCLAIYFALIGLICAVAWWFGTHDRPPDDRARHAPTRGKASASARHAPANAKASASSFLINPNPAAVVTPSPAILIQPSPNAIVVVRPVVQPTVTVEPSRTVRVQPSPTVTVESPQRGAWEEKGWIKKRDQRGDVYEGRFEITDLRTGQRRRFHGHIVMENGSAVPYIADPPRELTNHPKWACFKEWTPAPWRRVAWHVPARNADDAILYVEKVLYESING